ncbi:MAG: choice-of-anchor D domain-containing protein [Candidatus Kapabacteria bacterium]|jgi:hypothetical protein|nr:choice-of-anchor D domain-containing protein [Candidatus Kapabacteria bacterium]
MKRIVFLMMIILFVFCFAAQAEDFDKEHLPKLLGSSNAGTEFFLTFHPPYPNAAGQNFLKIYISSTVVTEVTLEVPGKNYIKTQNTIANGVIEFTLSPAIALCYSKQPNEKPQPEKVFKGAAIHIRSDAPIIAYGVIRYEYTSDGYLAIPVSGLGDEYIVASWPDPFGGDKGNILSSFTSIVAPYDNTKATVKFGGLRWTEAGSEHWTETAGGKKSGETSEFNMNSADVVLIGTVTEHGDLTGSKITSTKNTAVISGNYCAFIPLGVWACDVLIEMELPTYSWGTEYHVTPIYGRNKNSFIRVFAKEENTQVYRNGIVLDTITTSGGINGEGWFEYRAEDGDPVPVVISGDKPISVTQYNPGINDDAANDTDPFQMILTPLQLYQNEIMFNTPGIKGGYGFDNNFINLVYAATSEGKIPDDLMFAEVQEGEFVWYQLNTIDSIPGVEFSVPIAGERYFSKTIRLNVDGVYKIKAAAPFGAYSYGNSWCDTYGFPASVALNDLATSDTICPVVEWTTAKFGKVDGTVTDMPDEADDRSNLGSIYLYKPNSFNYIFEYDDYEHGVDRSTSWRLRPIKDWENAKAEIVFSDNRGNDTTIVIEYVAAALSGPRIFVSDHDFGDIDVGGTQNATVSIKNVGTSDLEIYKYIGPALKPIFEVISGLDFSQSNPLILTAGQESNFEVKFSPTKGGTYTDSIMFLSNTVRTDGAVVDSTCKLYGTSIRNVLAANSYDWLKRRIDRPGKFDKAPYDPDDNEKVILLTAAGSGPIKIAGMKISNDVNGSAFEFDRSAFVNASIEPESELYIPVKFHPIKTGVYSLKFTCDSPADSTYEIHLQGIGVVPKIMTSDIDFGATAVKDYNNSIHNKISIINLSIAMWEFADPVTITNFAISPPNAIKASINSNEYGSEGFRFDRNALRIMNADGSEKIAATGLPVVLQPGEYIEINAEFVAPRKGKMTASITTVSDAETEQTSVWTGADPTSVESLSFENFRGLKLLPSPVKDILIVQNTGAALNTDKIEIIDLSGRTIFKEQINILQGRYEINTSALINGMYILRIHAGERIISEKFTVGR